jgi:hypothetical protein
MASGRDGEVETLLDLVPRWASGRADVRAVALVGSWANGAPTPTSDVDLVLLTDEPMLYVEGEDWVGQLGGVALLNTRSWGAIIERRFRLPSGLEVEVGVGDPSWASVEPLDEGTRRVVTDGLKALYDPEGLLETLLERCRHSASASPS